MRRKKTPGTADENPARTAWARPETGPLPPPQRREPLRLWLCHECWMLFDSGYSLEKISAPAWTDDFRPVKCQNCQPKRKARNAIGKYEITSKRALRAKRTEGA